MANCKTCKADCAHRGESEKVCFGGYIPMTNADYIRAMSDERFAKALYGMQKAVCRHIAAAFGFPPDALNFADDAPDILEWLKQPYKENTDAKE